MGWLILYTICFITSIIGLIIGNTPTILIGGVIITLIDYHGIKTGALQPFIPTITYGLTLIISIVVHIYLYNLNSKILFTSILWGFALGGLVSYVESMGMLLYFKIRERKYSNY